MNFLDGDVVLYIVDTATQFFAAKALDNHSAIFRKSKKEILLLFAISWSLVYADVLDRLRDESFCFMLTSND